MKEIIVFVEHRQNKISDITLESFGFANAVKDLLEGKVSGILLADEEGKGMIEEIKGYCARLYFYKNPKFNYFNPEFCCDLITNFLKDRDEFLFITGQTAIGQELAPAIAVELGVPLITDVNGFELEANEMLFSRLMYGGKVGAKIKVKPQDSKVKSILTVQVGNFKPQKTDYKTEIFEQDVSIQNGGRTKFLGFKYAEVGEVDITKAEVIIGIGRGIKDKSNLPIIEELAKEIKGVLAGSRPAIDAGWLTKDRQIGSSGKTVKPKLYLALGISGAFQHIVGVKSSELILAVNKDPNAPIFSIAHYGVTEDLMKIVPVLVKRLRGEK